MKFKTVSIYGLGYIGLPTAAMFANSGVNVVGVDINKDIIETINSGSIHIVEPGLNKIVSECVANGKLRATDAPEVADAFIIAVPTPFKSTDTQIPEPDLTYIEHACSNIAKVLKRGDLVILESTSPVGTTEKVCGWLSKLRPDLIIAGKENKNPDVNVAHCPERVLPGKVMEELISNDRIIGGITSVCAKAAIALYSLFLKGSCFETDARTAELAKLTENASRDVQIAFANELSIICDELDVNVWDLINLANKHPRVNILQPGPGVGGHCIAVDPWFIASSAPHSSKLIKLSREINDQKPDWVIKKVNSLVDHFLICNPDKERRDVTIVCYGLAFKADIDDLRESPSLEIVKRLTAEHSGNVIAVEPNISDFKKIPTVQIVTLDEAKVLGDIEVLLVDHKEFKQIATTTEGTKGFRLDTRGIWNNG